MAHDATFPLRSLKIVRISDEAGLMTPVAGWYPDPAGTPDLRYWDGQTWTEQMAPAPAPVAAPQPYTSQPSYDYVQQPGAFAQPGATAFGGFPAQSAPRRSRRLYAVIAGVVAVVVVATAVPLALSSGGHSPRTNGAFEAALLTTSEVSETANGTFTLEPTEHDDDKDSSIGCPAADDLHKQFSAPDKAHAERTFGDKSVGLSASEFLAYSPGAAAEFKALEQAFSSCRTLRLSGATLELTTTVGHAITGSDETVVLRAHGVIANRAIGIDIELARFGDVVVGSFYGGLGGPDAIDDTADTLLSQAVAKATAKNAF
jgi:hypothetical protein